MPTVVDMVDPAQLQHEPPRRIPPLLLPNLVGEYLLARPWYAYIDPIVIGGLVAAVGLLLFRAGTWLWGALLLVVALRLGTALWQLLARALAEARLLRHGRILYAHVLRVRTCRDHAGNLAGAYIDCAMPISPRRTSVGSLWLPDESAANMLAARVRLRVICLPRSPGTWRLLDTPADTVVRYLS